MIKIVDDERLIAKVCDMHYNQNMSQKTISEKLNLSRPTISRIITNGRERGIVKITVDTYGVTDYLELERAVEERWGLRHIIVVEADQDPDVEKDRVGEAAAGYLDRIIKSDSIVGVSVGSTLGRVAPHIRRGPLSGTLFVPMIGGLGHVRMALHSNSLAENLARAYGGRNLLMHAPAQVGSPEIRRELMKDESIRGTLKVCESLDIAILGIGCPGSRSAIMATGYYDKEINAHLRSSHVAGDIMMQFFDSSGDYEPFQAYNNVVGIEIKKLRRVPDSICLACGTEKTEAIRGAIRGRYINSLVTDTETARALLSPG